MDQTLRNRKPTKKDPIVYVLVQPSVCNAETSLLSKYPDLGNQIQEIDQRSMKQKFGDLRDEIDQVLYRQARGIPLHVPCCGTIKVQPEHIAALATMGLTWFLGR